jgi:hypothetical protein
VHFHIVNETKQYAADPVSGEKLDAALLIRAAKALTIHMARDFAAHWENLPQFFSVGLLADAPKDAAIFHLVDTIPEAPDALAYHTVDAHGRPVLRLGVQTILANGGSLHTGPDSITAAMCHEVDETWVDGSCELYTYYDGTKKMAYEPDDPVQGSSYDIDGIAMSNFVTPRYFNTDDDKGPWDFLGTLKAPLTIASGGYAGFDDNTQIFGDKVSEFKRDQVLKYSRLAKRMKRVISSPPPPTLPNAG